MLARGSMRSDIHAVSLSFEMVAWLLYYYYRIRPERNVKDYTWDFSAASNRSA